MSETPAASAPKGKALRGRFKEALIMDLASGELTHAELGELHGLSEQGVHQFAVRNRAAINQLKEAGAEELAGLWGASRRLKIRDLEDEVAAVEEALEDPNLTPIERLKHRNLKRQLIRDLNEMCGHLLTRNAVSVESAPRLEHEIVGWSQELWVQSLGKRGDGSAADSEPVRAAAPAPEPPAEPARTPEPDRPSAPTTHSFDRSGWTNLPA
jgi:hypothetical protein